MGNLNEWLIDITFGDNPPCFVPYEKETGMVVLGMNVIADKCPGKLVGVFHSGGDDLVDAWLAKNPNWKEKFS